jgi:hypothetical protein
MAPTRNSWHSWIFEVDQTTAATLSTYAYRLGEHLVAAGAGIPVVLKIPAILRPELPPALQTILDRSQPSVLLIPTRRSLTTELLDELKASGSIGLALIETVGADDGGTLIGLRPVAEILGDVRERLIQRHKIRAPEHRFPTPPGTGWHHISIRFISGHDVHVQARAESAAYNFAQMGMANTKKKPPEPDVQWHLLVDFAENEGEITWRDSPAHPKLEKRRELLAKRLKTFFGIKDDPFERLPDGLGWRTRFTIMPEV